jgi:hypothetical protein
LLIFVKIDPAGKSVSREGAMLIVKGLLVVVFLVMIYGIYHLIGLEKMTDEERKELGFGPSGQGRGRRKTN